jgi:hypothetical protein
MLKNILKLNGAQKLSKTEQKSINGGIPYCAIGCSKNYGGSCFSQNLLNCCIKGWCGGPA